MKLRFVEVVSAYSFGSFKIYDHLEDRDSKASEITRESYGFQAACRHFRSTKGTSNQSRKSTQVATTSDLHYKLTNINQPHKDSIVEQANGIEPREAPLYFTETLFSTKSNKMKPILSSIPDTLYKVHFAKLGLTTFTRSGNFNRFYGSVHYLFIRFLWGMGV